MLRFPLHTKLILVTTAGVVSAEIVRATNEFIFCKNVEYQGIYLGKLYIDRNAIIGFSDIFESNSDEKDIKEVIKSTKIHNFNDYCKKTKQG